MWTPLAGGRLALLGVAVLALVGGAWLLIATIGQRQGVAIEVSAETRVTPTAIGSSEQMRSEANLETATFALG